MMGASPPGDAELLDALARDAEASAWPLLAWCEASGTCLFANAAARTAWPALRPGQAGALATWWASLWPQGQAGGEGPWHATAGQHLQRQWLPSTGAGTDEGHELLALRLPGAADPARWLLRLRPAAGEPVDPAGTTALSEAPSVALGLLARQPDGTGLRWLYRDGLFEGLAEAPTAAPSAWPAFDACVLWQAARQGGPATWTVEAAPAAGGALRTPWQLQVRPRPAASGQAPRCELRLVAECQVPPSPSPVDRIVAMALEHTVNGVVVADATRPGLPIVHVNAGFSRITGFEAQEVLGRNCKFLQGNDRDQAGVALLRQAIERQVAVTVRLRNYRKDGSLFWNQVELNPVRDPHSGAVSHFVALQTDVTLQHQIEEANLQRAIALERLFRGSPMGLLTLDEQGRAQIVSPALVKLLGLPSGAGRGVTVSQLRAAAAKRLGVAQEALRWPAPGQRSLWVGEDGQQAPQVIEVSLADLGAVGREQMAFFRDVSAEQSLHSMKTRFLTTAAHELRAPMGSIRGFTELLLMREHSREESRSMLETVLRQAMRLNALLSDLLDLSRLDAQGDQAFTVGPVPLAETMERALHIVELPGMVRRVQMQKPPADLRVQGHGAKLEQVLINLLSNALKYSPAGGPVHLRSMAADEPGWWTLAVQDQGLGLSEAHLQQLFTRFFRAEPDGPIPGTGLGLVIVKELVERMGGRITVSSQLGQGATFTVHLRLSEVPGAVAAPPGLLDFPCC